MQPIKDCKWEVRIYSKSIMGHTSYSFRARPLIKDVILVEVFSDWRFEDETDAIIAFENFAKINGISDLTLINCKGVIRGE